MNITDTRSYTECFIQLANVLDLDENRDDYHSLRVAAVSHMMAKRIGSPNLLEIFWAGLLHDIGAYGYNDFSISTSESLSSLEMTKIRNHSIRSYDIILNELPGEVHKVADFVKYHHEKYDGSGFPDGLAGNDIPLCSQIIKVADDFDIALRVNPKLPRETIYRMFNESIDREYSTEMISLFIDTMEHDNFYRQIELEAQVPEYIKKIMESLPVYKMFLETDLLEKITSVFAHIIDAKHEETLGHSGRVAYYSYRMAEQLNLSVRDRARAKLAGFMHDIGKAAIPRTILNKSTNLTPFEKHEIVGHPVLTMEILRNMTVFKDIVEIAGFHHERLNGSGYPEGLPAEDIPFLARLIAVADVYDAMTSGRRYQKNATPRESLDYLDSQKEILFDPDAVDALASVVEHEICTSSKNG